METAGQNCSHMGAMPGRSLVKEGLKLPSDSRVRKSRKEVEKEAEVQEKGLEREPGMR